MVNTVPPDTSIFIIRVSVLFVAWILCYGLIELVFWLAQSWILLSSWPLVILWRRFLWYCDKWVILFRSGKRLVEQPEYYSSINCLVFCFNWGHWANRKRGLDQTLSWEARSASSSKSAIQIFLLRVVFLKALYSSLHYPETCYWMYLSWSLSLRCCSYKLVPYMCRLSGWKLCYIIPSGFVYQLEKCKLIKQQFWHSGSH